MTLLPIVVRELVVTARRPATYWLRFWAAAGALAVFFILRLRTESLATLGHDILNALGIGALVFSMAAGVFLTADSLSVEKREGTLGLLFLTDLKGYDVVLGKLASHSLHALFGLVAVLPILALPLLTGGASGGEFWRLILVFLVTLFFSLSLGILVSAICSDGRQAMAGTFLGLAVSGGILPALWWPLTQVSSKISFDFLLWPSPVYAYMKGFDAAYLVRYGPSDYWHSLELILALALAALALASFILPRTWSRESSSSQKFRLGPKPRRLAAALERNPFYWLALGSATSNRALTWVLALFLPLWIIFGVISLDGSKSHALILICIFIAFGMHLTAKILMAAESGRRFHSDRHSGALELLLVTPLPDAAILAGQRQALGTHFKRSLWILGLVNVALMAWAFGFPDRLDMHGDDLWLFVELFFGGLVVLFVDFRAIVWAGMWNGLNARDHARSVLRTVGQVMIIPWLLILLLIFLEPRFGPGPSKPALIFATWFASGIVVDLVVAARAKHRLGQEFRSIVTQSKSRS